MIQRLVALSFLLLFFFSAQAQTPYPIKLAEPTESGLKTTTACGAGITPDAGAIGNITTVGNAAGGVIQSNDVPNTVMDTIYLCFNDQIRVDHSGIFNLLGDPDPLTPASPGYAFYDCPPTITGDELNTVLTDPCLRSGDLLDNTGAVISTSPIYLTTEDLIGTLNIVNNGALQIGFGGGGPIHMFFAPITVDESEDPIDGLPHFEGLPGQEGPCINVRTDQWFSIVYLNEITVSNLNNNLGGGDCSGSFMIEGGLPEFDGSFYVNSDITIVNDNDASITGRIRSGNRTHGGTMEFTVPEPGTYTITIEDEKTCPVSFQMDMSSCRTVEWITQNEVVNPGDTVCIDVIANGFTDISSFQYSVQFDPTVLEWVGTQDGAVVFPNLITGPAMVVDVVTVLWASDDLFAGESFPDGTVLYQLCFSAIAPVGSQSPIVFNDVLTDIEILEPDPVDGDPNPLGYTFGTGSITVVPDVFAMTLTQDSVTCNGDMDGSFTILATEGVPPYNYNWESLPGGALVDSGTIPTDGGSVTASSLPAGTYSVTLSDGTGLSEVQTIEVLQDNIILFDLDGIDPTCPNDTDGSVSISQGPIGGAGTPYTITWSTNAMNVTTISGLGSGSYSATVADSKGCETSVNELIGTFPIDIDTLLLQHITCQGGANSGIVNVQATGGTGPYTYSWSNGLSGQQITDLTADTYIVTVRDANMCSAMFSFTVNPVALPTIDSFDDSSVSCANSTDGVLTVTASPGNFPLDTIYWSDGQKGINLNTISGLSPGQYIVTVTDSEGCNVIDTAEVTSPDPLSILDTIKTNPSCFGLTDGSINISIQGGTSPYFYEWSNGQMGEGVAVISQLQGDSTYFATITDANNCESLIIPITLENPARITVDFTNVDSTNCFNGTINCTGTATAIASGGGAGTGFYDFMWDTGFDEDGVVMSTITGLCRGSYTVTVVDATNCFDSMEVFIGSPPELWFDSNGTQGGRVSCFGNTDGELSAQGTGGTPPYSYGWSTGDSGQTISGLAPSNNYTVTVFDNNNCTATTIVTVTEPDPLTLSLDTIGSNTSNPSCAGFTDGRISVVPSGGNLPGLAVYSWSGGITDTTSQVSGLTAGTYTVTVTDSKGCEGVLQHTLTQPPSVFGRIDPILPPQCFGFQTIVTVDTAYGGSGAPFSFSVDNGPMQPLNNGIAVFAGEDRLVQIFDSNGCPHDTLVTITQPSDFTVTLGDDFEIQLGTDTFLNVVNGISPPGTIIDSIAWTSTGPFVCDTMNAMDTICDLINIIGLLETSSYGVEVYNTAGCVAESQVTIDVDKELRVYIPNAFSPNGDGRNDIFKVATGTGVELIKSMKVFSRWGEQLFEAVDIFPDPNSQEGWDGSFKNKKMPMGVYVYLIEVQFLDGRVLLFRDDVTLIR